MTQRRKFEGQVGVAVVVVLVLGGGGGGASRGIVGAQGAKQAPRFEVDPMWPKPLPNHWVTGNIIGVSVDSKDHIWVIHRQATLEPKEVYASANPPAAECCLPAPP